MKKIGTMNKEISKQVLVLPDLHIPDHDRKTWRAVSQYIRDNDWDEVVLLGDFMDFDQIASYNLNALRKVEGKRLFKDYEIGNKFLDELQRDVGGAPITIIEGNHDERIERYINAHPELEGIIEMDKQLKFKERGIKWVRFASKGEMYSIGKATFIHGIYTTPNHAQKHVTEYERNIFYGHLHDFQQYSKRSIGANDVKVGQSLGCLQKYKPYYLKGYADKWQQGFAVFQFWQNGFFNYYPVAIFNHKFVTMNGLLYDGKERW